MSLRKFLESRKATQTASEKLLEEMTALQERLARRLEELVAGLDTRNAKILPTAENARRIEEIMGILRDEFRSEEWIDAISDYLDTFDNITESVLQYAESIGAVDGAPLSTMRRQYKALVATYLTTATSFSADLWIPLYQQISSAVAKGAAIDVALQGAREVLIGDGVTEGAIVGHAHTTVMDLASIYERTQTLVIADDLGAQFFLYQGSEIDTTREFCAERHGHVYHRKEIEEWASMDWAGKIPETTEATIFTLLGGYNCRHIVLPLAVGDVPSADLIRMRSKGLI